MYFSGQGHLYFGARVTGGLPQSLVWVGNVSALTIALETTKIEHQESYSGSRLTDLLLETSKKSSMTATFEDWSAENLARVLRGTVNTGSVTPVVAELVPTLGALLTNAAAVPVRVVAKGKNIGTITFVDSTGTPKVLVVNVNYRIISAAAGILEIYDITTGITGSLLEPLKLSYTPGASKNVALFTQAVTSYYMLFDGLNTADNNAAVIAEFYKVQIDPAAGIPLINSELGTFEMSGAVLLDGDRVSTDPFGQFGRITHV